MATQETGSSPQYSPQEVAGAFVTQYYRILHQSPEHVHKFYLDSSSMTRPGPDGLITITTMARINDLVASLAYHEYRTEILTADAQASFEGGVIVLVTGCLTGKNNLRRKFSQTFFLAPQEIGYYVHNDVFRYIDEDRAPVVDNPSDHLPKTPNEIPTPVEAVSNGNPEVDERSVEMSAIKESVSVAEPRAEVGMDQKDEQEIPAAAVETVSNDNLEVVEPSVEKSAVVKESVSAAESGAKVVLDQKDDQPAADIGADVSEDAPKKSYASILKVQKESKGAPAPAASKKLKPSPVTNGSQSGDGKTSGKLPPNGASNVAVVQSAGGPKDARESATSNGNCGNGTNKTDQVDGKGGGYSIYIGNLPPNASLSFVENEFKQFGPIRRGGIQVRWFKDFWFGFVEFESLESMQQAVEASVLYMGGYDVFIQEKTSKRGGNVTNPVSSVGGVLYRNNDGFRGQGNFSGGRRGDGYGGRNSDGYGGRNNDCYGGRNNEYGRRGEDYYYPNAPRARADGGRGGSKGYQNGGGRGFRGGR